MNRIFLILFIVILLSSCKKNEIDKVTYKRTGKVIKAVSKIKCEKAYGKWTLKKINISHRGKNKTTELNYLVYITKDRIVDINNNVIAKKNNNWDGIYTFNNLDSLNGYFYIKDAFENEMLTLNSGLTVKIKNNDIDKFTSTISLIFEK